MLSYGPSSLWAVAVGVLLIAAAILLAIARRQTKVHEDNEEIGFRSNLAVIRQRVAAATADPSAPPITALITGANSGIGFALARILSGAGVRVLLGCRHSGRGRDAVAKIKAANPAADVRLLLIDVSDPISVSRATAALQSDASLLGSCKHIDYLFLNAGVMPVGSKRWDIPVRAFFAAAMPLFFETGRCSPASPHFLQQPVDDAVACGAPSLFATHVLGHVMLAEQLVAAGLLADLPSPSSSAGAKGSSSSSASAAAMPSDAAPSSSSSLGSRAARIMWTSSRAACAPALHWQHIAPPAAPGEKSPFQQGWAGPNPSKRHGETYGEAKHAADLVNAALGRRLPHPCFTICPGAVDTEIMPPFFKPFLALFTALRAHLPGFNITAERGTHALLAVAALPAASLASDIKYVTWAGQLVPAGLGRGRWPVPVADQDRMLQLVEAWLALWRRHAADALKDEPAAALAARSGALKV